MIAPPDWLDPKKPCLVGLSGGRDSVALHHWLVGHGFQKLIYCHLNHGLRGKESDTDETFVRKLIGPDLLSKKTDVASLAAEKKLSLETAARNARHHFFEECAAQSGVNKVLLAHHADDQAETILFNLLRGSAGTKGMSTRQKINNLTFLRPLLAVRRSEINDFLTKGNHSFREDSSNSESFATRNRLRHEALPLLADILDRDPVPALLRSHQQTGELEQIVGSHLETLNILDPRGRIHLPSFRTLPPPLQKKFLHQFLKDHHIPNLSSDLISRALTLLSPDSPSTINLPGSQRLRRKESRLFISP